MLRGEVKPTNNRRTHIYLFYVFKGIRKISKLVHCLVVDPISWLKNILGIIFYWC